MRLRWLVVLFFISTNAMALDSSVECIQSVCGLKAKASPSDVSPEQMLSAETLIGKNLKKPISNYMGRVIHEALVTNQAFQSFLAMNRFPQLDSNFSGLMNAFLYLQKLSDYSKALEANAQNEYVINADKLKQQNPNLTELEQEAILSFNTNLNAFIVKGGYLNMSLPIALKLIYGDETSISMAQVQMAQEIRVTEDKVVNLFPVLKNYLGFHTFLDKALAGLPLSESEQRAMAEAYGQTLALKVITDSSSLEKFGRLPLNIVAAQISAKTKYDSSQLKTVFGNRPSIKGLFRDSYNRCMIDLSYSYAMLPTRSQIENFRGLLPAIQKQAQKIIEERKQASLGAPLQLEYQFPTAQEDFIDNISKFFDTEKLDLDTELKNKIDVTTDSGFEIAFFLSMNYNDGPFLEKAISLCEQLIPPALDDAAFRNTGIVRVSRSSIVHPELGVAVMAHELGHHVQARFPQDVSGELACLRATQGTEQYLNEDFADLFSAEVVRRLGYSLSGIGLENLGCAVADSDQKQNFVPEQLKNKDASDVHSSGLYRVLAFSVMTKGLTPQCQKVLTETQDTRFSSYCHWK